MTQCRLQAVPNLILQDSRSHCLRVYKYFRSIIKRKSFINTYKWTKIREKGRSAFSVKICHIIPFGFILCRCTKWTRYDVFMIRMHCHGNSTPERAGHAIYLTFTIKDGAAHPGPCPPPMSHLIDSRSWAKVPKAWS